MKDRASADRRILLVGLLNKYLPPDERPILVGGALVEFYTRGGYTTGDVDLIGNRSASGALLKAAGFKEEGRLFVREDLGLAVELPKDTLRRTETVVEFEVAGYRIRAVSIEDAIVDRLLAAKFRKSETDWEQAILLYGAHEKRLDRAALASKAKGNDLEDFVARLAETVERAAQK